MPQFFNQAQLSYNGSVINSNIAAGELVETLSVTKTAVADSYSRSDNVTYVVSIVNSGTAAFSSVTVTDDLGGYIYGGETLYPLTYTEGSLRVLSKLGSKSTTSLSMSASISSAIFAILASV